jgi:hypothetical protein
VHPKASQPCIQWVPGSYSQSVELHILLWSRMGGTCHRSQIHRHGGLCRIGAALFSTWLESQKSSHETIGPASTLNDRLETRKIKFFCNGSRDFLTPIRFVVHHMRNNEMAWDGWRRLHAHRGNLTDSGHRDLLRLLRRVFSYTLR